MDPFVRMRAGVRAPKERKCIFLRFFFAFLDFGTIRVFFAFFMRFFDLFFPAIFRFLLENVFD